MSYCTLDHLKEAASEAELIQMTDDEGRRAIDAGRVGRAIEDAETLIDSYLRRRYALPLADVPPLVRRIAVDLALHRIYERRFTSGDMPAGVRAKYLDSVKLLERIDAGQIVLTAAPVAADDAGPAATSGAATNSRVRLWPSTLLRRL